MSTIDRLVRPRRVMRPIAAALAAQYSGTRENRRVVQHAELLEHGEHLVGDRVTGRPEPLRRRPRRAFDRLRALVHLAPDLITPEPDEVVAVIERVVRDLAAGLPRGAELRRRCRPRKVATDREQRQGDRQFLREREEPVDRDVVDERARRAFRRSEPVNPEVVRDLVEIDADGAEAHDDGPNGPSGADRLRDFRG